MPATLEAVVLAGGSDGSAVEHQQGIVADAQTVADLVARAQSLAERAQTMQELATDEERETAEERLAEAVVERLERIVRPRLAAGDAVGLRAAPLVPVGAGGGGEVVGVLDSSAGDPAENEHRGDVGDQERQGNRRTNNHGIPRL